ncbi:4957_t:CDS:2 [Ambispora gerdemannii]|uniref:4957_t:CDS:1 n=1 Tax=Ambispora gerdemannii TaxID=144530 RepID=A0A9N8ZLW8_9GLOM|nr:4957_t:CDS:2 [Ambispora gerdemannii]
METWLLLLCCVVTVFCFQNIYVQVKRQGFVLICYSVANSLISLSFVISGLFLPNDFTTFPTNNDEEKTTLWHNLVCAISGVLLSANMIANYTTALALSIELFITLRRKQRATRTSEGLKKLYCFLCLVLPYAAALTGLVILLVNHDRVFDSAPESGVCTIARHGTNRIGLFMVLSLPEFLPIYPAAILSALALIPVGKKVFKTRQFTSSLDGPIKQQARAMTRVTRGGPPPVSHSNPKTIIPKNVLIRMGLWCGLLIISGVPTCTILLARSIQYLMTPSEDNETAIRLLRVFPDNRNFLSTNEIELKMLLSIILFLICFGTGRFAFEQYEELWQKICKTIFQNPFTILRKRKEGPPGEQNSMEIVLPEYQQQNSNNGAKPKPMKSFSYRTASFRTSVNTSSAAPAPYFRLQSDTPPDNASIQNDYFLNVPNLNGGGLGDDDILNTRVESIVELQSQSQPQPQITIPDPAFINKKIDP